MALETLNIYQLICPLKFTTPYKDYYYWLHFTMRKARHREVAVFPKFTELTSGGAELFWQFDSKAILLTIKLC
jgi:hypothetical protein